jgi:zinc transport system substrate-binding protein
MIGSRHLYAAVCAFLLPGIVPASAEAPRVVASIKPIHGLVAAVMDGAGEPQLLLEGGASPHSHALRPSQAEALESADIVFWVGPNLETFLAKPLQTLSDRARVAALGEADGVKRLPYREGGAFGDHDHAGEGHAHGEHAHGKHGDGEHAHDEDAGGHDHHNHDAHAHGEGEHEEAFDPHVWLDPGNAKAMTEAIAAILAETDPDNAGLYERNAAALQERLDALAAAVSEKLADLGDRPFIVFHDAYQYFEQRFGLEAAGAITIDPAKAPGAQRVAEIRAKIEEADAVCVFAEPQFESRVVATVTEGTGARIGVLDPLGAELEAGPEFYFRLMEQMAEAFADCLGASA